MLTVARFLGRVMKRSRTQRNFLLVRDRPELSYRVTIIPAIIRGASDANNNPR